MPQPNTPLALAAQPAPTVASSPAGKLPPGLLTDAQAFGMPPVADRAPLPNPGFGRQGAGAAPPGPGELFTDEDALGMAPTPDVAASAAPGAHRGFLSTLGHNVLAGIEGDVLSLAQPDRPLLGGPPAPGMRAINQAAAPIRQSIEADVENNSSPGLGGAIERGAGAMLPFALAPEGAAGRVAEEAPEAAGEAGTAAAKALPSFGKAVAKGAKEVAKQALIGGAAGAGAHVGRKLAPAHPELGAVLGGLAAAAGLEGSIGGVGAARRAITGGELAKAAKTEGPLETANASDVAAAFRTRMQSLDAAHDEAVASGKSRVQDMTNALASESEDAAETARGEMTRHFAPTRAEAASAEGEGLRRLNAALANIGAESIDPEELGQRIRGHLQAAKEAAGDEADRLFAAAKGDGDLQFSSKPVREAVETAKGSINPMAADALTARETALHDAIKGWPGSVDYETLKGLRSNISGAIEDARGNPRAVSRLITLRNGVDQAIEHDVTNVVKAQDAAVAAGKLAPAVTIRGTLQAAQKAAEAGLRGPALRKTADAAVPVEPGEEAVEGMAIGAPVRVDAAESPAATTPPAQPANLPDEASAEPTTAEKYATARQFWRAMQSTFGDRTAVSKVLQRGPFGGGNAVADGDVAGRLFHAREGQARDVRNYLAATKNDPDARQALVDAAAHDLRKNAMNPDGSLNVPRWRQWVSSHSGALGELGATDQFTEPARAQEALNDIRLQRARVGAVYDQAIGAAGQNTLARYLRTGPNGAASMRQYLEATGNTAEARQAMSDFLGSKLMTMAARNGGELSPGAYQQTMTQYRSALSELPEVRERFAALGQAQDEVQRQVGERLAAKRQFANSAAAHFLSGDPETAVRRAMSRTARNDPVRTMRELTDDVRDDPVALAGLRNAVGKWLGDSSSHGERFMPKAFTTTLKRDRAALGQVLTPEQMRALDRLGAAAQRQDSWFGRITTLLGHPGSLRLGLAALGWDIHGAVGVIGMEVIESLARSIAENRIKTVGDLVSRVTADPELVQSLAQPVPKSPLAARPFVRNLRRAALVSAMTPPGGQQTPVQAFARGGAALMGGLAR